MNKSFLFVIMMVAASFTGCIESEDLPIVEEDSSELEDGPKYSTAARTTEYDVLDDCPNGGIILEFGIDVNGNGTLDDVEVDGKHIVCHGSDGQDGEDGQDGQDGEDGQDGQDGEDGQDGQDGGHSSDMLITRLDSPNPLLECDYGGYTISYGLDNGDGLGISANGQLEDGEVDTSTTICTKSQIDLAIDYNLGSAGLMTWEFRGAEVVNDKIVFDTYFDDYWYELGVFDTSIGTYDLLKDINENGSSNPTFKVLLGDEIYFTANDGIHGNELWKTDGTESGTVMVADITPGLNGTNMGDLMVMNGTFYFESYTSEYGWELFKWNSEIGLELVKDIFPGENTYGLPNGSYPTLFIEFEGHIYFTARDSYNTGSGNYELWKTDGTENGTIMVRDINGDDSSSLVSQLIVYEDIIIFTANNGVNGTELWRTDGTELGTFMVKDINPGIGTSYSGQFISFDGLIYFSAQNSSYNIELWKTDGTSEGTSLVVDIKQGYGSSSPSSFTILNNNLYFSAADAEHGMELWTTDGTADGTSLVKDICLGPCDSQYLDDAMSMGATYSHDGHDYFVFAGNDNVYGFEPWITDGTEEGTFMLSDVHWGSSDSVNTMNYNSNCPIFVAVDDVFVFLAEDELYGTEFFWNQGQITEIYYS